MSNLHGDPPAVNAVDGVTPAPVPTTPAAELPPCPECGGELMRYLNRVTGEDELLCLECWWAVPTASFPASPVAQSG